MPKLIIDGKEIEAEEGATVFNAAQQVGVEIPALCHVPGVRPLTSCMLCIVDDTTSGRTFTSCSTIAEDGMVIETHNESLRAARQEVLQLLLSEHTGDCEAPCTRICPASLNVPLMMRKAVAGDTAGAARVAQDALIFPATLGYVCTATCERGCHRGSFDEPLFIRDIHRHLAEDALGDGQPQPDIAGESTGKQVAIVGAGIAGLTAAFVLQRGGHACRIFEKRDRPGGALRDLEEDALPHSVFQAEIETILQLGVELETGREIEDGAQLAALAVECDAVLLACDDLDDEAANIFSAGEFSMAVQSVGEGKRVATSVDRFLRGLPDLPRKGKLFDCRLGTLQDAEKASFAEYRMHPETRGQGRQEGSIEDEGRRCLHCDCLKLDSCKLRVYATEYGVKQMAYRGVARPPVEDIHKGGNAVFEPGKCIRCGLCAEIAERAGEALGVGFVERGFDVRVRVPFAGSLGEGLTIAERECVDACPTGALSMQDAEERDS
jgi:glutamate synthase (NADPH) small chain